MSLKQERKARKNAERAAREEKQAHKVIIGITVACIVITLIIVVAGLLI